MVKTGPAVSDKPLAGFTVAVTADRDRDELAALLDTTGARVVAAPAVRVVPLTDDVELRAATVAVVAQRPDIAIVTSGAGLRGWLEAADGWGLGDTLRSCLRQARIVARSPNLWSTLEALGLPVAWHASSGEDDAALARHLLQGAAGVTGTRIAVQLPGQTSPEFCDTLRAAGADVLEVSVHRWAAPADSGPLRRLVELIRLRLIDAVTFTSAPAATSLLRTAGEDTADVIRSLQTAVVAACIGPATAAPLQRLDVPFVAPGQPQLGALVDKLVEELPRRAPRMRIAGIDVTLRGHAAVVDGILRPLAPGAIAVLRRLAASPGSVLSRAELVRELPRGADEHAVEMAVARLRAALGGPRFVETVVKRGYRLPVEL